MSFLLVCHPTAVSFWVHAAVCVTGTCTLEVCPFWAIVLGQLGSFTELDVLCIQV